MDNALILIGLVPQQLVNGLTIGAVYALIALGYRMDYGVLQLISFAQGTSSCSASSSPSSS